MLKKILEYIKLEGEFNPKNIARNLKLNEAIVEEYLKVLIEKEYIVRETQSKCNITKCGACSCCCGEALNAANSWRFTQKAIKILSK
ncbi:MAG: winged helix-turn-helix domain-containing protein [Sarcina sp.]